MCLCVLQPLTFRYYVSSSLFYIVSTDQKLPTPKRVLARDVLSSAISAANMEV